LPLKGKYITLAQAVKVVGLANSGGEAKHLVRDGRFRVNGVVETQPGRKLRLGDRFGALGGPECVITVGE
jgi:ribosome-associated protein